MLQENKLPNWFIEEILSYMYTHELIIKNNDYKSVVHVPISVFPSTVTTYKLVLQILFWKSWILSNSF